MHLLSSDLNFKRSTVIAYQCCVYGLIHVRFRHCNIVFKSARDRLPQSMDNPQNRIAVFNRIYNYPYGSQVEDFIQSFSLFHLFVDAVIMFISPVDLVFYIEFTQRLLQLGNNLLNVIVLSVSLHPDSRNQTVVGLRFQGFQSKILQFEFYL